MTGIAESTRRYEVWVKEFTPLIRKDLDEKHREMRDSRFAFLRATFYRWAELWGESNPGLKGAPAVLGVGDLHVENFGTWRDTDGRLIWGVNDFDEACTVPYTSDLVRLTASAHLAADETRLSIAGKKINRAIVDGYVESLERAGGAFVLAEHHASFRSLALNELRNPERFWKKLEALKAWKGALPAKAANLLRFGVPDEAVELRVVHRAAGLGSRGRQRWMALYSLGGAYLSREVKARVPSGWDWARGVHGRANARDLPRVWERSTRVNDPFLRVSKKWLVKRLSPDCSRIELSDLPGKKDEARLLHAMGYETANVHVGSGISKEILKHLRSLPADWLEQAVRRMLERIDHDFRAWQRR